MRNDRVKSAVAVTGAFLLVLAVGTLGWALLRGNSSSKETADWQAAGEGASQGPSDPAPTTEAAPTTPPPTTRAPATTPPPKKPKPKIIPKPTATKEIADKVEAPPAPPPPPAGCQATHTGTDAPISDVKAALLSAASQNWWNGVVPDPALTVPRPNITIPADLIKALAWQESGWQSAVLACDSGIGIMQITTSSGTDEFINLRFGMDWDPKVLKDNTEMGAAYLEYLIMYFGTRYFAQTFDLNAVAAVGPGGASVSLIDAVLASYNMGPEAIKVDASTLSIPSVGQHYADNIKALRTSCPCQSY